MSLTLVIGGVRSGKSAHAERLALASGRPVRYVATADSGDDSMSTRIQAHRARRPQEWETVEAGDALAEALAGDGALSLVDGLGTWLAGALYRSDGGPTRVHDEVERLIEHAAHSEVIVIAEQAGEGMLPLDGVSRRWLDALGEATQRLAGAAIRVDHVIAGRALTLPPAADPAAAASADADADALRHHGDGDLSPGLRDHAVNVLAGGPPNWLRDAMHAAVDQSAERYPDEAAATAALAALHDRDAAEVVITNGAAEALWLLPAALRPRLAACVHPGFTESEAALRAHGVAVARCLRDPETGFALDPGAVPEAADLVIVGNPASPSGTLDPASAIQALIRPGRTVVVDEAFMGLVPGEPGSLVSEGADGVIVVRSLTKLLALPGIRVGYALATPATAARLQSVRPPWSANAIALAAIAAAAARPDALAAAAQRAAAESADLAARLTDLPDVRTWPTVTNFALIEVAEGGTVHRALRERGFAVRHAASFPGLGDRYLRLTARSPEENTRLVDALRLILAERAVTA